MKLIIVGVIFFYSCCPSRDPKTGKFWTSEHVWKRMVARNFNHCKIYYDRFDNPIPYK